MSLDADHIQQTALEGTEVFSYINPARRIYSLACTDDDGNAVLVALPFAAARAFIEDALDAMDRIDEQHRANLDLNAR